VTQPWFDNSILFLIFISSVVLIIDVDPLRDTEDTEATVNVFVAWCNWLFTITFTMELLTKAIAYGLVMHPGSYLRDSWNCLDFVVVIASLVSLFAAGSVVKTLRIVRCLRPLRAIKRAPALKVVVDALVDCIPGFINVATVVAMVYLVFAIVGVQFFAGRFWKCNDSTVTTVEYCHGEYYTDANTTATRSWDNSIQNFDTIATSFLTLFEIASLEMWLDPLWDGMDAPDYIGNQPEQDHSWYLALYFVIFIIIGGFTAINLFIGVVCENFHDARRENLGLPLLTPTQADFIEAIESFKCGTPQVRPSPPGIDTRCLSVRLLAYNIVQYDTAGEGTGATFDAVITFIIYLNCVVMTCYYWEPPPDSAFPVLAGSDAAMIDHHKGWTDGLEVLNTIFAWIFFGEMCLKMTGLGSQYFNDGWNKFDCSLVIISLVVMCLELIASGEDTSPSPPLHLI